MNPDHEADDLQNLLHEEYGAPPLDDQFSADLIAQLQAETAPSQALSKTRRSPLAIWLGVTTVAVLVIALTWISIPETPENHRELALQITNEAAPSDHLHQSDKLSEETDSYRLDTLSTLIEHEIESAPRPLNERLVQNESRFESILHDAKDSKRTEQEKLSVTPLSLVGAQKLRSLSRQSLQQSVAAAKVILVATALKSALAPPKQPGDGPENLITFQVTRVHKGNFPEMFVTTRTPTNPHEFLDNQWVIMLSAEFLADKHQFAGLYGIKLEPKIQALITGKQ